LKKVLSLIFSLVVLTGMALAQYPVGPNAGTQVTPFSNQYFSATFNANPTVGTGARSDTAMNYTVSSYTESPVVGQSITVRIVDHDIPVDYTSSDFYANNDSTGGEVITTSRNVWEGHPFTYVARKFTVNGETFQKRERYIIVNSREAIFLTEIIPAGQDDQNEWLDFEYSLRIK
jgi:hypothetical protein